MPNLLLGISTYFAITHETFTINVQNKQITDIQKIYRGSPPEAFLGKGVLKICSKFTGEHPHRSAILVKLQSSFIEIPLRYGCSLVNLLHILRTSSSKKTSGRLLLNIELFKRFWRLSSVLFDLYLEVLIQQPINWSKYYETLINL